jgi:hypothetical protein
MAHGCFGDGMADRSYQFFLVTSSIVVDACSHLDLVGSIMLSP